MKTIVLDATQLSRDFMCRGLPYQLLEHMMHATWVTVCVPASVLEETVANFGRAVADAAIALQRLNRSHRILGLPPVDPVRHGGGFDYRAYLTDRFDEVLGISVLPWPTVSHQDLTVRAVERHRPFNAAGSGYRDSLVWADVISLVASGHHVALVSNDKVFSDGDGRLARQLLREAEGLAGDVELVTDFDEWLVSQLPWQESDLMSAVAASRNESFYNYYVQADLQDTLWPDTKDLGFRRRPTACEVTSVEWGGGFEPVSATESPDGLTLVEYDLDQEVEFVARFRDDLDLAPDWDVIDPDPFGEVSATGKIKLIVRMGVLFGDEFGFSVNDLVWRRADGTGPGLDPVKHDPDQLRLV